MSKKRSGKKAVYFGAKDRERTRKLKDRNNRLTVEEQDKQIEE